MTHEAAAGEGFVYVADAKPGPMVGAAVGRRVVMERFEPPWIVVDRSLRTVLPSGWPGHLYRVAVVEPRTDDERVAVARAAENLRVPWTYTRTFAVDVLAEVPVAELFGAHGDAVVAILDVACALTPDTARRLADALRPAAERRYSQAWDRWLADQANAAPYRGTDHTSVVSIPGAGPSGSPVGHGLGELYGAVRRSARERGGPQAFTIEYDEDGDGDGEQGREVLAEPWSDALWALLHAAMALGAPELTNDQDKEILTAPWRALTTSAVATEAPAR